MNTSSTGQLPPGQQLVAPGKWPTIGEKVPAPFSGSPEEWVLSIEGELARPLQLSLAQLFEMGLTQQTIDIHCVTRWSMLDVSFEGVPLRQLLELAQPNSSARFISFHSHSVRNHTTSLSLPVALAQETLIALKANGQRLAMERGGPVRNIVPGRYFYKSVKWLKKIELLAQDRLGFWEAESGYHNDADPWLEQRYLASRLDRRETAELIQSRNFSERDLMGLLAADRILTGLMAFKSLLRNADFKRCDLRGADFRQANLSNAHLEFSNLRDCNFEGADLEGANFTGADLAGANLLGCSMIGCSFFDPQVGEEGGAKFDRHTQISPLEIAPLFPEQFQFVERRCRELKLPGFN